MSDTVIKAENISKQYQLGLVGTNTLKGDMQRWWYNMRGKPDPTLQIGVENKLNTIDGEYVWALRDINFEIKQGEVVGIIGKNGAGKSTLLKIISRITAPTTGQIKVKGRIASLLEVGTGFHGELSGRENIFVNGAILGMTKAEIRSKFDEIVDFSGVEKYIDTPVKRYSSGMYVRLAFAVAAHLEPEILIVDEVLAVGDAEFQKKAIGKMQDISSGQGRTVLFVSHNMASIKNLCRKSILLENGIISLIGETDIVIANYIELNHIGELTNNSKTFRDEFCHIENINIRQINKNPEINTNGDELTVNFQFISEINENFAVIMNVFREEVLSFASTSFSHEMPFSGIGRFDISFIIPKYLLNPGFHSIDLSIVDHTGNFKQYLYAKDVLFFTIHDDNFRRGNKYNKGWSGLTSPILNILIKKIEE